MSRKTQRACPLLVIKIVLKLLSASDERLLGGSSARVGRWGCDLIRICSSLADKTRIT